MNVNVADPYAHRLSRVQPLYVSNARRRSELRPIERQDGFAAVSDDFIQRASVVDPRFGVSVFRSAGVHWLKVLMSYGRAEWLGAFPT